MFAMSKQSRAPICDSSSSDDTRASRSSRRRSKRTRSSQSTPIVPYVCSPIASPRASLVQSIAAYILGALTVLFVSARVQTIAGPEWRVRGRQAGAHDCEETTQMEHGNSTEHRLGWVGTGRKGYALVSRLLEAGCDVAIFNRTRSKAEPLADVGGTI